MINMKPPTMSGSLYDRYRMAREQERAGRSSISGWGGTDVNKSDWSNWSGGPGGPVMAKNPISSLDREGRLTRMSREAGAPVPEDIMPPISSMPDNDPTMGFPLPEGASIDDMNRVVDENGIPMNLSSVGWMKDMRFYRFGRTPIGMM